MGADLMEVKKIDFEIEGLRYANGEKNDILP